MFLLQINENAFSLWKQDFIIVLYLDGASTLLHVNKNIFPFQ